MTFCTRKVFRSREHTLTTCSQIKACFCRKTSLSQVFNKWPLTENPNGYLLSLNKHFAQLAEWHWLLLLLKYIRFSTFPEEERNNGWQEGGKAEISRKNRATTDLEVFWEIFSWFSHSRWRERRQQRKRGERIKRNSNLSFTRCENSLEK